MGQKGNPVQGSHAGAAARASAGRAAAKRAWHLAEARNPLVRNPPVWVRRRRPFPIATLTYSLVAVFWAPLPAQAAILDLGGSLLSQWLPGLALGAAALAGLEAWRCRRRAKAAQARLRAAWTAASDAERIAARARADAQGLKALLCVDAPRVLLWPGPGQPHQGIGLAVEELDGILGPAAPEARALLADLRAGRLQEVTRALKDAHGRALLLEGLAVGGAGLLRLRETAGLGAGAAGLTALLDAAPLPVWLRDEAGMLAYANPAFLALVGAETLEAARDGGLDLLDQKTRALVRMAEEGAGVFKGRIKAVAQGRRCQFDVVEVAGEFGVAGCAADVTEAESAKAETARTVAAHRRTLDQLSTAVAIFGADERLAFHNAAYERLFDLAPAFLDQRPSDGEILEALRVARKVPEQANFRAWRAELKKAYRAIEPMDDFWHLPGGQMLRVVITPNAEGGVTYLFDDLSEHVALESRYNSLIRIQGETLDGLAEAVAVFGSDGRLDLYNEAFLSLWSLSAQALGEKPHIDAVAAMCRPLHGESSAFSRIRAVVTAIERREPSQFRIERPDGRVLDGTAQPLPDGGTMVTFRDVTDSVKVERALVERNEALEAADKLKNAFVGHVSYHLRTPLNTLMGYADMLREGIAGPLSERQREYLDHMRQSSDVLRALIDDILDLATIDAGAMELDLAEVDVHELLTGAAEAVHDLLQEAEVRLALAVAPDAGVFTADARRVRQILFNLLSNAIAVSPAGSEVTLGAERRADGLLLTVRDEGPGIPAEAAQTMFDRFESRSAGQRHRGAGLGLSIVRSFMELHGGTVSVKAAGARGTLATCIFPLEGAGRREAAE